jgi:single-strand DNA-binding protein
MLNKIILIGRLTRDPELKYTPQGTAVANFTLAINRKFNRDQTDFIDIVTWKGLAENCANYLHKGSLSAVEGSLQIRTYENKDGKKVKVAEVVADDVRFLDSKKSGESKPPQKQTSSGDWDDLKRTDANLEDIEITDKEDEISF